VCDKTLFLKKKFGMNKYLELLASLTSSHSVLGITDRKAASCSAVQ